MSGLTLLVAIQVDHPLTPSVDSSIAKKTYTLRNNYNLRYYAYDTQDLFVGERDD